MDTLTIFKIIGSVIAVFSLWKTLYIINLDKKSRLREEYYFAKKFIIEADSNDIHPYPLELAYQAIAGTSSVKAKDIKYILSLENPVQCLRDYVLSKELMCELETEGDLRLKFKDKYIKKWSRTWRKGMYFIFYMIFALIAISPLIIINHFNTQLIKTVVLLFFTLPIGGLYAWLALNAYSKIKRGEALVDGQQQHTQRVVVIT